MMLRVSVEMQGQQAELDPIVTGSGGVLGSSVPHAAELLAFAEAAMGGDETALERERDRLIEAVGSEGFVDAACVVGNFQRMVRIADGTGIPLDAPLNALTSDIQQELGLGDFAGAENTGTTGPLTRLLVRAFRPLMGPALRLMARQMRR